MTHQTFWTNPSSSPKNRLGCKPPALRARGTPPSVSIVSSEAVHKLQCEQQLTDACSKSFYYLLHFEVYKFNTASYNCAQHWLEHIHVVSALHEQASSCCIDWHECESNFYFNSLSMMWPASSEYEAIAGALKHRCHYKRIDIKTTWYFH